jgi:sugar O-acyltransferase (sialic acid O-acetyltransferase NeuD family)
VRVVIVGAGGHGQVVADIFREAQRSGGENRVVGYVDDNVAAHGRTLVGAQVVGGISALASVPHDAIVVAIGDNDTRWRLSLGLAARHTFVIAEHPSSIVSQDVTIGAGSMLCAGAIVNTGSTIGRGVILNTGCTVDHHAVIGDFVHIAPGVHLGGEVRIGEGAFVGIGAIVLPRVQIGVNTIVGAGAVVTKDVPPGITVVGCPARPLAVLAGSRS